MRTPLIGITAALARTLAMDVPENVPDCATYEFVGMSGEEPSDDGSITVNVKFQWQWLQVTTEVEQ